MSDSCLEERLISLSRHYDMLAEVRMETLGYQPSGQKKSFLYRSIRAIKRHFLSHYFAAPPTWRKLIRRIGDTRTLPDFCVVGPFKAGTSDLAVNILLHPNVMPPLSKEFWERNPEEWRVYYATETQKRTYAKYHGVSLSPYLTPALHFMEVPYNLSKVKPNAKVVITLRDPVERFFSHWKWEMFLSGKNVAYSLPFLSTFPAYVERSLVVFPNLPMFSSCGLSGLEASIYWKAVEYWIECFGSDNVLVLDVGDYFRDRNGFLRKIHEFVGLPHVTAPTYKKKTNENPLKLPPPDDESISKLRKFFEPHNERLWQVIGKEFEW
jgi:hypothetical protein